MARIIWGVAALAVAIVGCRSEGSESKGAAPKVTEAIEPTPGGHVRLPSAEPRWLNPVLETRFDLANTILYEGLVGIDAKGEPTPRLAESWTVSPDGLTITFKLRDASWHDNQKVTAEDVAFTFEAVRKTTRPTLWQSYMAPVARVTTPDDHTVVVGYASPQASALAAWTMPIIPAHVFRGEHDLAESPGNREAVGSGPFRLVRWETGKRIVMTAFDRWWGGKPLLGSVELVLGVSDGEMLGQLRRGQLDWAPIRIVDDALELTISPELRDEFEHSEAVEPRLRLIGWNTDQRPFDDKRVRQALTLALDRSRVIDDVLHGQAQLISGPFFPNMMGPDPTIAPLPFDLAKAKALLDAALPNKGPAAGSAVGAPRYRLMIDMIGLESQRSPVTDAMLAIFRRDLEQIGVGIKLTILPSKDYFEKIAKREFTATLFSWLPDIPDPDPYGLLHSSQIGIGSNYAGFASTELDALLDDARRATDPKERRAVFAKIHAIVADEMPYTPLFSPYGHYAWNRRLRGVGVRDLGPQPIAPGIARWWVAQTVTTN
jgi:peptide/nickel transport system substrate-binding protein